MVSIMVVDDFIFTLGSMVSNCLILLVLNGWLWLSGKEWITLMGMILKAVDCMFCLMFMITVVVISCRDLCFYSWFINTISIIYILLLWLGKMVGLYWLLLVVVLDSQDNYKYPFLTLIFIRVSWIFLIILPSYYLIKDWTRLIDMELVVDMGLDMEAKRLLNYKKGS